MSLLRHVWLDVTVSPCAVLHRIQVFLLSRDVSTATRGDLSRMTTRRVMAVTTGRSGLPGKRDPLASSLSKVRPWMLATSPCSRTLPQLRHRSKNCRMRVRECTCTYVCTGLNVRVGKEKKGHREK